VEQRIETPREKVLVVSIDFDGCLGSHLFVERYQKLLQQYKTPENIPPDEYEKAVVEANEVLFDSVKEGADGYYIVVIMVGSNRRSAEKDQDDGPKNKNGSAFRAIEHFANALRKNITPPVEINKRVVFDSVLGQKPGYNFDLKEKQTLEDDVRQPYLMSGDMKFRLAYFQIHDVCASHPNSDVTYVHADDRDDIVRVSANTYANQETGGMLPTNLKKASFLHYEEYNPIAELIGIQRDLSIRISNKTPSDDSYIRNTKERIKSAVEIILADMSLLVDLTKEQQLDEKTQPEIEKAKKILQNMPLMTQLDQIETIEELSSFCKEINGVMANNVRNITLPQELSEPYDAQKKILYAQRITEFGSFERQVGSAGYTIPQGQYDSLIKTCCQDDYPKSSDPMSTLRQITTESRCYEFEQLVGKLKEALVHEKKGNKWRDLISDKYNAIDFKKHDEKTIAIMQLSNMVYTLRQHVASGDMNYQEAIEELKPSIEKAINKAQNKTFFGWLGITQSNVAKQLTTFKKDFLEFKERIHQIIPHETEKDERDDREINLP